MTKLPVLEDLELDYLVELFNLGMAKAATALSRILDHEVLISVPKICFCDRYTLDIHLSKREVVGAAQSLHGEFDATAILLMAIEDIAPIINRMYQVAPVGYHPDDIQREAVTELGNIVISACLSSLSQSFETTFDIELPVFFAGCNQDIVKTNLRPLDVMLLVQIQLQVQGTQFDAYLVFLVGPETRENFLSLLRRALHNLPGIPA